MKLTVKNADLRRAMSMAMQCIERRSTIPILTTLLLKADGKELTARGTDLDLEITARIPATGELAALMAEPRAFVSSLKEAGGESVDISVEAPQGEDKRAVITTKSGVLHVGQKQFGAVDDFPVIAVDNAPQWSAVLPGEVVAALSRIAPAISVEETRYYLNGVYMHRVKDDVYRWVATDGHRLCTYEFTLPDAVGAMPAGTLIIPRKSIQLLMAANISGGVAMEIFATKCRFSYDDDGMAVQMLTKTIDGTFPDYSRVIPSVESRTTSLEFHTAELGRALRSFAFGGKKIKAIKFEVDATGAVSIYGAYPDSSTSQRVAVQCEHNVTAGWFIGFNSAYVLALIEASRGGKVVLTNDGTASAPTVFLNPEDPAWLGVQMPMKV